MKDRQWYILVKIESATTEAQSSISFLKRSHISSWNFRKDWSFQGFFFKTRKFDLKIDFGPVLIGARCLQTEFLLNHISCFNTHKDQSGSCYRHKQYPYHYVAWLKVKILCQSQHCIISDIEAPTPKDNND